MILIPFYILFFSLFCYNLLQNDFSKSNVEVVISIMMLFVAFIQSIISSVFGIVDVNNRLKKDDFSKLVLNCTNTSTCNEYPNQFQTGEKHNESFTNLNSTSNQLKEISSNPKYGPNYLKTVGNIPISFYNPNLKDYQDLILADFYYPCSGYSYLSTSPLHGIPDLNALRIAISYYKARMIHLDIYTDSSDPYDPNANPIVRCENMQQGATPLLFDDVLATINKWAWINNDPNNASYPFFIYMQFKFALNNENIYTKIYNSLIKFFSTYLPDRKYGFAGRNATFPLSQGRMKDFIGKIVFITNHYPTYDQFLKDLDFQYDNGYGIQQLSGTIWLINGDWFERGEYDGSEWWEYKTCPQIPEYLNPL